MAWYNAGTVQVASGSATVVGTGTAFVSNVTRGEGFVAPDGRIYQITDIPDNTHLTLSRTYLGVNASNQAYEIMPTQSFAAALASQIATLVNDYAVVRDTIGQGKFPAGTAAAPGIAFANDQDTGLSNPAANSLAFNTGGVERGLFLPLGHLQLRYNLGVGVSPLAGTNIYTRTASTGQAYYADNGSNTGWFVNFQSSKTLIGNDFGAPLSLQSGNGNVDQLLLHPNGNVGIRTASPQAPLHVFGTSDTPTLSGYNGVHLVVHGSSTLRVMFGTMPSFPFSGFIQATDTAGSAFPYSINPLGGDVGIGTISPVSRLHVAKNGAEGVEFFPGFSTNLNFIQHYNRAGLTACGVQNEAAYHTWSIYGAEKLRVASGGNFMAGGILTDPGYHSIGKNGSAGSPILEVSQTGTFISARFHVVDSQNLGNTSDCAVRIGQNLTTGRSLNAPGTINAGGADYAEFMLKAEGCGDIAKGDVCGVDENGQLTKKFADAYSYVVKSTKPSLVGGDTWGDEAGEKPTAPLTPPALAPFVLEAPVDDDDDEAITAYEAAVDAYAAIIEEHDAAMSQYDIDLAAFEAAHDEWQTKHDALRARVDRIAFSGQVPANVTGDFAVGDYIIAVASGAGIKAVAVKDDDITFAQYKKRVGKVWAIRDGRAWIDVQHS